MRAIADWYAARGFVVVCSDLFWRQAPGIQLTDRTQEEWQRALQLYQGFDGAKAVADSAAAVTFLGAHPACTGKVGAIGFCLGGKLAYLLAARHDGAAAELANLRTLESCLRHVGLNFGAPLSPSPQRLSELWEEHLRYEFTTRHTEDTLATMVADAYVDHIPVLTGGVGREALREFYAHRFIPHMSRTRA
jgi:dienelactone hydrolase family protein